MNKNYYLKESSFVICNSSFLLNGKAAIFNQNKKSEETKLIEWKGISCQE